MAAVAADAAQRQLLNDDVAPRRPRRTQNLINGAARRRSQTAKDDREGRAAQPSAALAFSISERRALRRVRVCR